MTAVLGIGTTHLAGALRPGKANEVADAIRHGDDDHLCEELGDLLLQVVLHAQIANESQRFNLAQVADGIRAKLIRRHPHVFGGEPRSWDAIKAEEQAQNETASTSPLSDLLANKVRGQPALAGAMTISKKAANAGFEWDNLGGVWEKVCEELAELQEAIASGDTQHAQEELGDVLFTLVNVARWCGINPEEGLAGTNQRFLDRFSRVESALGATFKATVSRNLRFSGGKPKLSFDPKGCALKPDQDHVLKKTAK